MTSVHNGKQQSSPRRASRFACLGLATALLAACAPGSADMDPALGWQAGGSSKALEVDRAQYRHAVYFGTDQDRLTGSEQDRLIAFLRAVQPSENDSIRIEGHADRRANDLYNLDLASRRMASVKEFLRDHGVKQLKLQSSAFGERAPVDPGDGEPAWWKNRRVEIVLERYLVTPPACPDWSRQSGLDYANKPHTNFGCATEANLGLMVADPRDLVRGRTLDPADGVHQAEGVVRYREGDLPELKEESVN